MDARYKCYEFYLSLIMWRNKLGCSSVVNSFQPILAFGSRIGAFPRKADHMVTHSLGHTPNNSPWTNTLAYFAEKKSFITRMQAYVGMQGFHLSP